MTLPKFIQEMQSVPTSQGPVKKTSVPLPKSNLRDLVFQTSQWDRYLWDKAFAKADGLEEAVNKGKEKICTWEGFGRETFSRLHNASDLPSLEQVDGGDQWASNLHAEMQEMPEFQTLKRKTIGDALWSSIGSEALLEALSEKVNKNLPQDEKRLKQQVENAQSRLQEDPENPILKMALGELETKLHNTQKASAALQESMGKDAAQIRQSIRKAVKSANEKIDEMQDCFSCIGSGRGQEGKTDGVDQRFEIADKIRKNPSLKELAKIAGRLRSIASQKRKNRCEQIKNELHSVETGKDVLNVLPSEFAMLRTPETSLHFYAKYTSETLLQYRLEGKEKQARGPVILCIDVSGSMKGTRELWSKGIFLALLDLCRKDKRDLHLHYFDDGLQRSYAFPHKQTIDVNNIFAATSFFSGGGTSLDEVLSVACGQVESASDKSLRKADIVIVTDGAVSVENALVNRIKASQKKSGLNILGIVLAGNSEPLEKIGARCVSVGNLEHNDDDTATTALFSL